MGWKIAFAAALLVWICFEIRGWWLRREKRRLLTDEECRRWYPIMQGIVSNTRGKHDDDRVYDRVLQ